MYQTFWNKNFFFCLIDRSVHWGMLKQLDGSLSVSIVFDSWLGASPLANYQPSSYCSVWRTERNVRTVLLLRSVRIEPNQTYGLVLVALPLSHTFRTRNISVYLIFLSGTAHSLLSSYCSVWRTERNVRTVNAQGAPSLIRCKRSKLNETYGPYGRCSRFVTAFTVRKDRRSKLRTESVRVYWTCVL